MTAISSAIISQAAPARPLETTRNGSVAQSSALQAALQPRDQIEISAEGRQLQADDDRKGSQNPQDLSPEERKKVQELQGRDREVRAHEQAHLSALAGEGGSAQFQYEQGPDGRRYAVEGEVPVSIGEVSGNPKATIEKARRIARAAVAPAEPSAADQRARAKAQQVETEARAKLAETEKAEREGEATPASSTGIDAASTAATSLIDDTEAVTPGAENEACGVCHPSKQGKSAPQISVVIEGAQVA